MTAENTRLQSEIYRLRQLVADLTPLARLGLETLGWQDERNYNVSNVVRTDTPATRRARKYLERKQEGK